MPRNSSGVYALPAGNPVISDTFIQTDWANPTLSDIAQCLTDSLDRNGRGGMLAPFKIADGTAAAPGLAFLAEPSTGIFRPGAQVLGFSVFGTSVGQFSAAGVLTVKNFASGGGAYPQFSGDVPAGGQVGFAGTRGGKLHWAIVMPDTTPESGGNVGGDFGIYRYDDAGAQIGAGPALAITRATGAVNISQNLGVNGTFSVAGAATFSSTINATGGITTGSAINAASLAATAGDVSFFTDGRGLRFVDMSNAILCTSGVISLYTAGAPRISIAATGTVSIGGVLAMSNDQSITWGPGFTGLHGNGTSFQLVMTCNGTDRFAVGTTGASITGTLGVTGGITGASISSTGSIISVNGDFSAQKDGTGLRFSDPGTAILYSAGSVIHWVGGSARLTLTASGDCNLTGDALFAANKGPRWGATTNIAGGPATIDFYANNARRLGIDAAGNLLLIAGEAYKSVGGPWVAISDERIKENITDYTRGLEAVIALRPVTYTFKPDTKQDTSKVHHGLIAQEVQPVMPEMISEAGETFADTPYAGVAATVPEGGPLLLLDATALTYALCNAARELSDLIEALDVRLTNLEGAI